MKGTFQRGKGIRLFVGYRDLAYTTGFTLAPTAVAQTACKRQQRRCF